MSSYNLGVRGCSPTKKELG